jgi:hypothetical protein
MPDRKKPTKKRSTDRAPRRETAKELSAEQLENVAGGLLPAAEEPVFKFFRPGQTTAASDVYVKLDGIKFAGVDGEAIVKKK